MHHQHNQPSSPEQPTALELVGRDPARLLTVSEYWTEFDEPIELFDANRTFTEDGERLVRICVEHRIPYRREEGEPAFPVWLLREFYPANP